MPKKLPKVPKVDKQGRSSKQRLRGVRAARFKRRFGEELLSSLGFDGSDFKSGGIVKGKLGLFTGPIGGKIKRGKGGDVGGLPSMDSPKQESNKSNPTLTTVLDQFRELIKSANKLGVISKQQEEAILEKIKETRSADRESLIERKDDAESIPNSGISPENLEPLVESIKDLLEKINGFGEKLDEKKKESEDDSSDGTFASRFFDELGFGEEYESYKQKKDARAEREASPENQKRRRKAARDARVSRFNPDQLLDRNGRPLRGNALNQRLGLLERQAAPVRRPSILSRTSSRLSSFIGTGASRASSMARGATNLGSLRSSLKRVAGPLITKSLGKTALKSIPILGAVAGAGFAIDKLLDGDPVGAGLDLFSGLGGPITAIPAMIASLVRDSYSSIYGIQPEQDPEAPKRLGVLKDETEKLVKEAMGSQVEVKKKPTKESLDRALVPQKPPTKPPASPSAQDKHKIIDKPPAPQTKVAPSPSSTPSPPANKSSGSGSKSGGTVSPSKAGLPTSGQIMDSTNASLVSNPPTAGMQIAEETKKIEQLDEGGFDIIDPSTKQVLPSSKPTTRPGAAGMGDVRSPYYDITEMGSIFNQVYY